MREDARPVAGEVRPKASGVVRRDADPSPQAVGASQWGMTAVAPLPAEAEIFLDARGDARSLRVRWHHENGLVVLSLWRAGECTGSFRLQVDEVPLLIETLRAGLDAAYDAVRRG